MGPLQARSHRQGAGSSASNPDAAFAVPDAGYAPHAFWFWNGRDDLADPERFAHQARLMAGQGLNPGYVHARYHHPDHPFWRTPAWYASFAAALDATAPTGARLAYAMGDPSFPDKYILPDHPELRARSLAWTTLTVAGGAVAALPESLFAVVAQRDAQGRILAASLEVVGDGAARSWTAPAGSAWTVFVFTAYHGVHPGGTAISVLDRRTTAHWLELEHARYEQLVGAHFGRTMDSVFFDHEGSYGYKLAWSDDLAADYARRKGSDIRRWMPLMIEEDADGRWMKARWDWFEAVGRLYSEVLFAPLDAWCRARGLAMTSHLWEERLAVQALQTGSYLGCQRACSMPGTDALFREIHHVRPFTETQSVGELEGRQVMCEALGIAGWHLFPAEMKRAADAAVARGITRFVLHGVNSNRELRNVAYPPDFLDWNPYWRHLHLWTASVRRAAAVNDQGHLDARVLLLCPMDSVWALLGDGIFDPARPHDTYLTGSRHLADARHMPEIDAIDAAYGAAMEALATARVAHLIADGPALEAMVAADGALRHGAFAFTTIVLPPLRLLPMAVAARIADLAAQGGRIIALGSLPDASAERGRGDPELAALVGRIRAAPGFTAAPEGLAQLLAADDPGLEPAVVVESGDLPLTVSRRVVDGRVFLWLANGGDVSGRAVLRVPRAVGRVELWDCEDGSRRAVPSAGLSDGSSRVVLDIAANAGFWLVVDPAQAPLAPVPPPPPPRRVELTGPWTVSVDPADQPDPAQHSLAAPDWLLAGGAQRPLASWLAWGLRAFTGFVDYRCELELAEVTGDEVLDLGTVRHLAEVRINGVLAAVRLWAPYRYAVGPLLRPGRNAIHVRVGNLLLNAVTRYPDYRWRWYQPPTDDQLDAGLLGPVTLGAQASACQGDAAPKTAG